MFRSSSIIWPTLGQLDTRRSATLLLVAGAFVLALEPAMWLVGTWYEDGYQGMGWIAFALVAVLVGWSRTSSLTTPVEVNLLTYGLLLLSACIRLLAQILDINVLGAMLLGVDVYALARIAGLSQRRRAISELWLAVVFLFSLPVEPIVQRLIGYDLQQISAWVACGFLSPIFSELSCQGVRLQVNYVDVLVDLPCSGSELVSITALIFAVINTVRRPSARWGMIATLLAVVVALSGNGLRIAILAAGLAHGPDLGFNVMAPVPHTAIGLGIIALVSGLLWWLSSFYDSASRTPLRSATKGGEGHTRVHRIFALMFFPITLLVGVIQPQPVDAFPRLLPPSIPSYAAGFLKQQSPLSDQERGYFTRYGGGAKRASYGPFGLLLVTTRSPLRHLHDPTICLSGSGYTVDFLGTDHDTKTAIYKAVRKGALADADEFKVHVSYQSDRGQIASSVSEAIWYWLRAPDSVWTMVQRIVPVHPGVDSALAEEWERTMRRAYNII